MLNILQIIKKLIKAFRILGNKIMFLRVCKEFRLPQEDIDIIAAVIQCESGFDDQAINNNVNGTIDFGICQFNNYWMWERESVIHPDIALNNPEEAIRTMIKLYLKGRIKNWVCYSSGLYRKYL